MLVVLVEIFVVLVVTFVLVVDKFVIVAYVHDKMGILRKYNFTCFLVYLGYEP